MCNSGSTTKKEHIFSRIKVPGGGALVQIFRKVSGRSTMRRQLLMTTFTSNDVDRYIAGGYEGQAGEFAKLAVAQLNDPYGEARGYAAVVTFWDGDSYVFDVEKKPPTPPEPILTATPITCG